LREFIETALNPYLGETAAGAWGIDVVNFFTVPAAEPAEDQ
jgi:hypothetical protein